MNIIVCKLGGREGMEGKEGNLIFFFLSSFKKKLFQWNNQRKLESEKNRNKNQKNQILTQAVVTVSFSTLSALSFFKERRFIENSNGMLTLPVDAAKGTSFVSLVRMAR